MDYIQLNNEITIKKDGFYQLDKDKEAIKLFKKEVNENYIKFDNYNERMKYLIKNDYYYNVYEQYNEKQIDSIFIYLYSIKFEFQSFMAISKFYKDYAMKTNDKKKYLEHYQDRIAIVSLFLGQGNFDKALDYAEQLIKQNYQPATPTFLNAGKKRRGEMVSCFLLEMDDTLNSIGFNINTSMQLSKIGGGVALNLSKLRARGEQIKEIDNAASGIIPVMKLLEDSFSYANQLGQRKGAGAVYLNIFHADLVEFLDTKKINADEKIRMQSLSLGLIIPNKFLEIASKDGEFYLFYPYSVYKEYGIHMDDMDLDKMYEELVNNPNVKKSKEPLNAIDILDKIAQIQMESGYPYIMYKTNANEQHPLKDIGQIKFSNLCSEIFQLQETSIIEDYDKEDDIRRDINCNLGSLNIANVMKNKDFRKAVHISIDALTSVSDLSNISNAPSIKKANDELHSVGLGAMNLHGYLTKNKIMYESNEARDFVRTFFMMVNYYSLEKSMIIAKEKSETFKDFEKSEYYNGNYFKKYLIEDFSPKTNRVKELFEDIYIPSPEDWDILSKDIKKFGLYNAYRLAIAPTQSISYIQNSTSSIMPAVSMIENRTYEKSTTYYPMPFLSKENYWFYAKSAFDMDQKKIIDLVAEAQNHIDQGISTTLFVNSDTSTRQLCIYHIYANYKKLKSIYYTRVRNLKTNECESCSV